MNFNSESYIEEDLLNWPDYEIHRYCSNNVALQNFALPIQMIEDCGKVQVLKKLLKTLKEDNHRVLLFSQMTKVCFHYYYHRI